MHRDFEIPWVTNREEIEQVIGVIAKVNSNIKQIHFIEKSVDMLSCNLVVVLVDTIYICEEYQLLNEIVNKLTKYSATVHVFNVNEELPIKIQVELLNNSKCLFGNEYRTYELNDAQRLYVINSIQSTMDNSRKSYESRHVRIEDCESEDLLNWDVLDNINSALRESGKAAEKAIVLLKATGVKNIDEIENKYEYINYLVNHKYSSNDVYTLSEYEEAFKKVEALVLGFVKEIEELVVCTK